ncbi:RmlC-like cupin domain-containing protein [Lobosporangium transversale]|uniref:Cysteine dioxygenase n=1 Tax=Lobosporangium transversale TaxID=64571 RepID=A0A1Y2GWX6_9FUNG|nr:RmlC-like cupin domain-containing protein [Lobosporangium transversale]ORZ26314.1 RmlC-like cupin domain-containing protein [Lobosporangium transversale]|eukprot:XP_021884079.1 RmlC-like cupin domain-containing protein [Lobosporangium transversale]
MPINSEQDGVNATPYPKNDANVPVPKDLDDLVRLLHLELGDNGLDSDGVDVERIQKLMANYKSNEQDWSKYALFDKGRYTRNLVDDGNGKFNLMILAWPETIGSAIHDHSGSHCLMKILDGELKETLYHWPEKLIQESDNTDSGVGSDNSDDEDKKSATTAMKVKKETFLQRDTVAYMHDKLGLHAVANPLKTQGSISLHLYTPPYETCKTFNERSSKARSSGKCVFYSSRGQKIESCPSVEYLKCSLTNTK